MLELEEARARLLQAIEPLPTETVPTSSALGRVLAQAISAAIPLPPFDNAAMDGYAVRSEDVREASPGRPVPLRLAGQIAAGESSGVAVEPGTWFFPKSKSSAGKRSLKLTSEARSIFARRISQVGSSSWIFGGKKNGTHLTDIQNAHSKVLEDTGLAFVIYDFRHTAATRWAERGMDIAGQTSGSRQPSLGHAVHPHFAGPIWIKQSCDMANVPVRRIDDLPSASRRVTVPPPKGEQCSEFSGPILAQCWP